MQKDKYCISVFRLPTHTETLLQIHNEMVKYCYRVTDIHALLEGNCGTKEIFIGQIHKRFG